MENWLRLFVLEMLAISACRCCQYPHFVQSRREPSQLVSDWSVQTTDNKGHRATVTISFEGMMMHSSVSWSSGGSGAEDASRDATTAAAPALLRHSSLRPYTRECREQLGVNQDRYLSTNRFRGPTGDQGGTGAETSSYVCLGFVRRSRSVVQLKTSRLSDVFDRSLCDDGELDLEDRVLVNRQSFYSDYEPCLVKGGYNVRIYDKAQQRGLCDAYEAETRVESECMPGEGVVFRFRYAQCRPRSMGMQTTTQRAYCLGSWTEAGYSYSVLRHDSQNHVWCLRYPTDETLRRAMTSFSGHLFRDGLCVRTRIPNATDNYLRLDMTRDTFYGTSVNPCADDYEACAYARDPCSRPSTAMTCAKTCKVCVPGEWPATCAVPDHLRGRWIERNELVEIGNSSMVIFNNGIFHCVQWEKMENRPVIEDGTIVWEQMFVTTFSGGCRPRYACVRFEKTADAHSVLRYKLSQSEVWPFVQKTDSSSAAAVQIGCDRFVYRDDNEPFGSRYRSTDMKTLVAETQRIYVDCKLPKAVEFEAEFGRSHCTCRGRLTQEGLGTNKRISIVYDVCPGMEREERYNCLESTYGSSAAGKSWKIVGLSVRSGDVACLYFPAAPDTRFYLMKLSDCIGGADYRIAAGTLQPDVTYVKMHGKQNPSVSYTYPKDDRELEKTKEVEKTKDLENEALNSDQPESHNLDVDDEYGMNDNYRPAWYEYNDEQIVGGDLRSGGTVLLHSSSSLCLVVLVAIRMTGQHGIKFLINRTSN